MRYGLQLVPHGAFPQDIALGIHLQDEPVVIIPDACPVATPCVPSCTHWQYWIFAHAYLGSETRNCDIHTWGAGFGFDSGALTGADGATVTLSTSQSGGVHLKYEFYVVLIPIIQTCGHRLRFVTTGENGFFSSLLVTNDVDGNNAEALTYSGNFGATSPAHLTTTAKVQIDLTDAALGLETWTDLGPVVELTNF